MELNTWLYFNARAWGNENKDLYNVPLWYVCVCMYVFIWRVCLGRVQKVSSYDLKCLQKLLPFLKATVSECLVTFFIINAKVMKLPSLRPKQFSYFRFHTPVLWSVFFLERDSVYYISNRFESFPCWDLYGVNCLQMICRAPRAPPCAHTCIHHCCTSPRTQRRGLEHFSGQFRPFKINTVIAQESGNQLTIERFVELVINYS